MFNKTSIILILAIVAGILLFVFLGGSPVNNIGANILGLEESSGSVGPDLVITESSLTQIPTTSSIIFRIALENQGNKPVMNDFSVFGVNQENPSMASRIILTVPVKNSPFGAGSTKILTKEIPFSEFKDTQGVYVFSVDNCAFPYCANQVVETNENNNDSRAYYSF